jgi:polyhydroxybutyrate depolymerase
MTCDHRGSPAASSSSREPTSVSDRSTARRRPRTLLPAVLAGLALLTTACATSSAAEPPARTYSGEVRDVTVEVDGRARSYLLQPAVGLEPGEQSALVVVLHQEGGTPQGVAAETDLAELRRQGATLAYPAGVDRSWDAGACCGTPKDTGVDDVTFLDAVLADAAEQAPVDPDRTALVGYSSGGMLTYRYVCDRPGTLAAAVVVSGSLESPCDDAITTPDVLTVHGTSDGTIGVDQPKFIQALGLAPRPVVSTLGILTRSAGCRTTPTTTQSPDAEVRHWAGCRGGEVTAQLVTGAGHGWDKLDASRRTSEFLLTHLMER